jgi:asparagine synthase (glutamine-hydrolysing)
VGNAVLGHTRLSIIDLAQGSQPMTDDEQRHWIVFNGEIFNYRELRAELSAKGCAFRTHSDTEVLLKAYLHYGKDVVAKLRGQFAFVVWDRLAGTFFAARDAMGEKPFYWAHATHGGSILIASEIKALRASGLVDMKVAPDALQLCLAFGYMPPDRSAYSSIQTLPPAHFMEGDQEGVRMQRYWTPQLSNNNAGSLRIEEIVEQTQALLHQAVQRQMVADVPLGALLSGGLDSTSVVALMAETSTRQVQTYAAGFGREINELPFAAQASAAYKTNHHELQIDIPVAEELAKLATIYDEPYPDSSAIPTLLISKFARQHVKVVLTGDGGDEIFGGYDWYRWFLLRDRMNMRLLATRVAQIGLRQLKRAGWQRADGLQRLGSGVRDYRRLRREFNDPLQEHLKEATMSFTLDSPQFRVMGATVTWAQMVAESTPPINANGVDRVTAFDLTHYLPGDVLTKVDRATMTYGLESRAPLLDLDLANHVLSIPHQIRMAWPRSKPLMRAAMEQRWPKEIARREKQGFGAPIKAWLQRPDMQALTTQVNAPGSRLRELMPLLPKDIFAPSTRPRLAWTLLTLGLWAEHHA